MGSVNSAELPLPEHCCASIQVKCVRQEEMGHIVAVPVCQSVFRDPSQFLFQMLYKASNEPSVRHWFLNGSTPLDPTVDRTAVIENNRTAEEFYHDLFLAEGVETNTGCKTTRLEADDARAQELSPKATTRWMTVHIPAAIYASTADGSEPPVGFFDVETATRFIQDNKKIRDNCWVVGYFECTHYRATKDSLTPPPSHMRHWMSKCFMTEGRSLVLFQVASFMEARRMQLARLRAVNPTALEFSLRVGDCSSLRALESSYRRLFQGNDTAPGGAGNFVSVRPEETNPQQVIKVAFDLPALDHLLPPLENAVQGYCPPKQVVDEDGNVVMVVLACGDLGEAVEKEDLKCKLLLHIDVAAIKVDDHAPPTPFAAAVAVAKPIWAAENRIVQESHELRVPNETVGGATPTKKNQARKEMRKQFFLGLKNNQNNQPPPQHQQKPQAAENQHPQQFASPPLNQQQYPLQPGYMPQQQRQQQPYYHHHGGGGHLPAHGQQYQQHHNQAYQQPNPQQPHHYQQYQQHAPQQHHHAAVVAAPGGVGVSVAGQGLSCVNGCLAPYQNSDGTTVSCCPNPQQ